MLEHFRYLFTFEQFNFVILFAVLAYFAILKILNIRLYDPKKMQDILKRSAKLREELKEAEKTKDEKKFEEISKKAEEVSKESLTLNIEMFKNLFILSTIFLLTMFVLEKLSPYDVDDIIINLPDEKTMFCDKANKELINSLIDDKHLLACYQFGDYDNSGTWRIKVLDKYDHLIADDYIIYVNGQKNFVKHDSLRKYEIYQNHENKTYQKNEILLLFANTSDENLIKSTAKVVLSNGTSLLWILPFKIPIIEVDTITDIQGAFILTIFVVSYSYAIIKWLLNQIKKILSSMESLKTHANKQ
ncbi:MAG: EMC3/TMCO1 family protein [Candidatus Anstonellales archaeon]